MSTNDKIREYDNAKEIWNFFKNLGLTDHGIAGMLGNIEAESGLRPNNLQDTGNAALGVSDKDYTAMVDSGKYTAFASDQRGYGICQWTSNGRKVNLETKAKTLKVSVGSLEVQLPHLWDELNTSYKKTLAVLKTATTIAEASNMFMLDFERPRDKSPQAQAKRAAMGQKYLDEFKEEEIVSYDDFKAFMARYEQEQGALPPSTWAKNSNVSEKAKELGITAKAERPRSAATREEVQQMIIGYNEKMKG